MTKQDLEEQLDILIDIQNSININRIPYNFREQMLKLIQDQIIEAVNSIELEKKNKDWKRTEQDPTEDELASIDGYNQAVDDFNEQKAKLIEGLR